MESVGVVAGILAIHDNIPGLLTPKSWVDDDQESWIFCREAAKIPEVVFFTW